MAPARPYAGLDPILFGKIPFALSLSKGCRKRGESFDRLSFDKLRMLGSFDRFRTNGLLANPAEPGSGLSLRHR